MNRVPAKVRLVSTDFDGTIHEEFVRPGIPAALQRKISDLQKSGVTWVINTGRGMTSLMQSLEHADIEVRPDFVVLVEREIFRRDASGGYVPVEPWNTACQQDHDGLFDSLSSHMARLRTELVRDFAAEIYEDPHSPICVIAQNDLQMDTIETAIRLNLQPFPSSQVVRNSVYLRLSHHRYSKGTALAEIQRILGVTSEHTVVAGDHLNDLPMLDRSYARYLISPQNSVPTVRTRIQEQGGYLARENAGLGVLEGLHALGV